MSLASEPAARTAPATAAAPSSPTRPLYWSVRRELWEHRSVYIAPLVVAGVVLLGFVVRLVHLPQAIHMVATLDAGKQQIAFAAPFGIVAAAIAITGLIVAFFYCLGALYNERRDRSILFWKSLPVSDTTAVLSKAAIPFVALPVAVFAIAIATQLVMLVIGTAALAANGMDAAALWTHWPILKMSVVLAYALAAATLWYAPLYGWLLLVSSWARSMAILWAVLPPLGLAIAERIAFDTSYVSSLLDYRLGGFVEAAFRFKPHGGGLGDPLAILAPAKFLGTPGLWAGLAVAAACLAGAIWMRRNREPI
ncbi:MAG TPA: hypothetical protein VG819_03810 [Rhizomicrobium sp.]|jgi:ABC-2 type transport system permease protein|nr:hypothetical protein [Rhizomicrobium sp.]